MANADFWQGNFYGRALISQHATIGGAKDVFVKLQGVKNDLVFPTFGGTIMNPFKGPAKLFAGDLAEYRTDAQGVRPQYWILKTYLVVSQNDKKVKIARDGFKHVPFAGDMLMNAPDVVGGTGKAATVLGVAAEKEGNADVWTLTMDKALPANAGDVLVEAEANPSSTTANDTHRMVVKAVNSVCACDYDFRFAAVDNPAGASRDFEAAEYDVALALGGLMYAHKMSPMPKCVLDLNESSVKGWFRISSDNAAQHKLAAVMAAMH